MGRQGASPSSRSEETCVGVKIDVGDFNSESRVRFSSLHKEICPDLP